MLEHMKKHLDRLPIRRLKKVLRDRRVPSSLNDEVILATLEGINTPRSLAVWLMYKHKSHDELVDLTTNPNDYEFSAKGARMFRDDYAATELLSKAEFLHLTLDRDEVAYAKFFDAEQRNRQTNRRFRAGYELETHNYEWLLHATTRKIAQILGEFDPVEWFDSCSWGPGASFALRGVDTSPANKFRYETGITRELYYLVRDLIPAWSPLWATSLTEAGFPSFCFGNEVTTVPKNAKTNRVIAIEPGLNVYFQLGLGNMIGSRLLRAEGIDLRSQERNRLLCFYGSLSNLVATVDFSSASDTISVNVVRTLLPSIWFEVLDRCRSKLGKVYDKWISMEKFSSMGNGFTFPLQSLIFFAAAHACCKLVGVSTEYIGVFGDDVVIPVEAYDTFQQFCTTLGFSFNGRKSFSTGPFRESCGSHYYWGLDVKPVYFKQVLKDSIDVYIRANALRRLAHRRNNYYGCDARLRPAWLRLRNAVPEELRFSISEGYGDGGFVDNFDSSVPEPYRPKRVENYVEGYCTPSVVLVPVMREKYHSGILLATLHHRAVYEHRFFAGSFFSTRRREQESVSDHLTLLRSWRSSFDPGKPRDDPKDPKGNAYPLRQAVRSKISLLLIHSWYNLGPWY